jgi:hypothetical protein
MIFNYGLRSSKPFPSQSDAELQKAGASTVIEGVWWKQEAKVTGFMALANTTSNILTAIVNVNDDNGTSIGQHAVTLAPHGTKMLDLNELASTPNSVGGIRVSYAGAATDLLVNGGLEDASTGIRRPFPLHQLLPPAPPRLPPWRSWD